MLQGLSQTLRWEDRQVFSRVGWAMTLLVVLQLAVQVLGLRLAAALAPAFWRLPGSTGCCRRPAAIWWPFQRPT